MLKEALYHQSYGNYAYPIGEDELLLQLRAKKGDLDNVYVIYDGRFRDWEQNPPRFRVQMNKYSSDRLYDYFKVKIKYCKKKFKYFFLLDDGVEELYYSNYGFSYNLPEHMGCFQYTYICEQDRFKTPDWVQNAVFYQIFPERFYNGDPELNPDNITSWDDRSPTADSFYGGDLRGVIEKLDYLENLGITAIYLTPVFASSSNHKYDVIDYKKIDSDFGDLDTCQELVEEAHSRNIKVVFDGVFNHTSDKFFAFQDVLAKGADSDYKDWYYIDDFPVQEKPDLDSQDPVDYPVPNYETFANQVWSMPKLKTANPEVRNYILDVARYWIEEVGIDGWRLDVADEVDHYLWREFRKEVKSVAEDTYIVGEVWNDASPWLNGAEFDGVMNYLFAEAVGDFFCQRKIDVNTFENRLATVRTNYKEQAQHASLNLVDSHDTARILQIAQQDKTRQKLVVAFQMTYVGPPMIYYGDEVGVTGGDDPDCRRPMIWEREKQDTDLYNWYKKLINIRNQNPALRTGDFELINKEAMKGTYSFVRKKKDNQLIVVFNNDNLKSELEFNLNKLDLVSQEFKDLISLQRYQVVDNKLKVEIEPYSVVVLKAR